MSMVHRPPDKSLDTDWRKSCPWCGRRFGSGSMVQDHEPKCPEWGTPQSTTGPSGDSDG